MDFFRSKLFAYLITVAAIGIAVWQVGIAGQDNSQKFVTLCQVQERFLEDVITTRQESAEKPGVSEAQAQVDRDAAARYQVTLNLLHTEFPKGCE